MEVLGVLQNITYSAFNSTSSKSLDTEFSQYLDKVLESQKADGSSTLEQKYGEIIWHIGDASGFSNWERNDFPVERLFLENGDITSLYGWEPKDKRTNPSGFEKSTPVYNF